MTVLDRATQPEHHPAGAPEPVVRLVDVHKRFGDLVVLDGIDLDLRAGMTTVVLGESGSGKSVLLQHIVCLMRPDSGEVVFKGRRIDNLPERELTTIRCRFGFLFQLSALFDSMTAGQNVAYPIREHTQQSKREADRLALEKLALVGLEHVFDKMPSQLSGGQKKRVALARAIALDPEVILYDEPTTGLDPPRADEINDLIRKLQHELSVTGVVVTHDMASARKVADRIVMLREGTFIFDGTAESIGQSDDPRVRAFVEGRALREEERQLLEKVRS
jgi:phospholipid/cholesterol/gamma-HCH transport system ATP-binding protein